MDCIHTFNHQTLLTGMIYTLDFLFLPVGFGSLDGFVQKYQNTESVMLPLDTETMNAMYGKARKPTLLLAGQSGEKVTAHKDSGRW